MSLIDCRNQIIEVSKLIKQESVPFYNKNANFP